MRSKDELNDLGFDSHTHNLSTTQQNLSLGLSTVVWEGSLYVVSTKFLYSYNLNTFHVNVAFQYPLKTSENLGIWNKICQ